MANALYDYDVLEADDPSPDEYFVAMQEAINGGAAWSMQGSVGRSMMNAIEGGYCLLGKAPAKDYYGNFIPSRDMVVAGTKGSYAYVAEKSGKEYADRMAAI